MVFQVSERCQWSDGDTGEITAGTVEAIIPPKRVKPADWWNSTKYSEADREDFITYANVKWDDGTTDAVDIDDLDEEDSELEKQFRQTADQILEQINAHLDAASEALGKAVDLSEKHGVPFSAGISFLGQSYNPVSASEKWPGVDYSFMQDITGTSNEYGYAGWQHSDVC